MSAIPSGPGARPKTSVRASHVSDGRVSPAAVFTAGPTLAGADQASSVEARDATYRSCPPWAPGYEWFEENTISRPSLRTFGWMSLPALLSSITGAAGPKPSPLALGLEVDVAGD